MNEDGVCEMTGVFCLPGDQGFATLSVSCVEGGDWSVALAQAIMGPSNPLRLDENTLLEIPLPNGQTVRNALEG